MLRNLDRSLPSLPRPGLFEISPGRKVSGTITIAGRNTRLHLWDDSMLDVKSNSLIFGVLDDLTRVSLLGSSTVNKKTIGTGYGNRYMCDILSQYVVLGEHIEHDEPSIEEMTFQLYDVSFFNDQDAFGSTFFNDPELFRQIAQSKGGRIEQVEEWNWIQYFTGSSEVLGQVSARHTPTFSAGISVDNVPTSDVVVRIKPLAPVTVVEALTRVETVLQFFDAIGGHSQNTRDSSLSEGCSAVGLRYVFPFSRTEGR